MDQPRRESNIRLPVPALLSYRLNLTKRQTGRRSDSAHAYIHATRAKHSNLYLACNTKVDKVIIENGRAVGVQTLLVFVPWTHVPNTS